MQTQPPLFYLIQTKVFWTRGKGCRIIWSTHTFSSCWIDLSCVQCLHIAGGTDICSESRDRRVGSPTTAGGSTQPWNKCKQVRVAVTTRGLRHSYLRLSLEWLHVFRGPRPQTETDPLHKNLGNQDEEQKRLLTALMMKVNPAPHPEGMISRVWGSTSRNTRQDSGGSGMDSHPRSELKNISKITWSRLQHNLI